VISRRSQSEQTTQENWQKSSTAKDDDVGKQSLHDVTMHC